MGSEWTIIPFTDAVSVNPPVALQRGQAYPPDMQARATDLVLQQAEVLCGEWFK